MQYNSVSIPIHEPQIEILLAKIRQIKTLLVQTPLASLAPIKRSCGQPKNTWNNLILQLY